jgi:hypothetical protein
VTLFKQTGWRFVTSGGGEIDVGFSKFLYVAAEAGAFYAQKNGEKAIWRLPFMAAGAGAGLGVSAGGPITVSVSLPCQWGGGFTIYRNPLRRSALGLDSFTGGFVAISGGIMAGFAGSGSFLFFGASEGLLAKVTALASVIAGPAALAARIDTTVLACEGAGALWGTGETSAAGISGTIFTGHIFNPQPAIPHETGD